ncbi:hypothetical protein [Methanosarcina sp. KYL-1]|uniref:hypothetical protein n=1 Tax=Methanosarcina sp. KYL-1 TaxID=2602068 RepID=UPI002101B282|nr:hypothetical protein [Methanosarcina sp. KYL-1]
MVAVGVDIPCIFFRVTPRRGYKLTAFYSQVLFCKKALAGRAPVPAQDSGNSSQAA